jgi:hypothetical protein
LLHADNGCDSSAIRRQVDVKWIMPNIPPNAPPLEKLLLTRALS